MKKGALPAYCRTATTIMDIVQLQYFQTAAKEQHFTRAAAKLNVSQPTLSASISRLENELNCSLFNRTGRQIQLNENGEILLKHVNVILQSYQEALWELDSFQRRNSNALTIACMTMIVHNKFLAPFQKLHPEIQLHQQMLLADGLAAAIHDHHIDFIIANLPIQDESIASLLLTSDQLYLALSRNHPLSRKGSYTMEDIANEKFVINPGGTGFVKIFKDLFLSRQLAVPQVTYALPSEWQSFINDGYAAISTEDYFLHGALDSSVVFLPPSDPTCCRQLSLIWNSRKELSRAARLFLQFFQTT